MSKTILITGATDRIGLVTAQRLASQGHKLLLHGRNATKLAAAASKLGVESESYLVDLSSFTEVADLAEAIAGQHKHLDVLIDNAGVFKTPQPRTADGLDSRFVVNTLTPYLLTRRPYLARSLLMTSLPMHKASWQSPSGPGKWRGNSLMDLP